MPKPLQLVGKQFGEWAVVASIPVPKGKNTKFLCRCSCGYEGPVSGTALVHGRSKSCGHKVKIGDVFAELEVVGEEGRNKYGSCVWVCRCSCGATTTVSSGSLTSGNTRSCGHLSPVQKTHGGTDDREYEIWQGIKRRCHNPNDPKYRRYGARGIAVCDRWMSDYAAFLTDMGRRPFANAQIDRINNNKGYEPGNCRWATPKENARNRCSSRILTGPDGTHRTIAEWAERLGISPSTITTRLKYGWREIDAVSVGRLVNKYASPNAAEWAPRKSRQMKGQP